MFILHRAPDDSTLGSTTYKTCPGAERSTLSIPKRVSSDEKLANDVNEEEIFVNYSDGFICIIVR